MTRYPKDRGPTPRELEYIKIIHAGGVFDIGRWRYKLDVIEEQCFNKGWVGLDPDTDDYFIKPKGEEYLREIKKDEKKT